MKVRPVLLMSCVCAFVVAALCGCAVGKRTPPRGFPALATAAPALTEMRFTNGVAPTQDGMLLRLRYVEGPNFGVLFGGTQATLQWRQAGSGISLDSGWSYVTGTFPAAFAGQGVLRTLWPIIIRSTMAVGSDGTEFIVDCSDRDRPWVHCRQGGPVRVYDYKTPASPVEKVVLSPGQSAQLLVSNAGVSVLSTGATNTGDAKYQEIVAKAQVYGLTSINP